MKQRERQIRLLQGDCLKRLRELRANSVDSLVTDPPAGISFMGKDWDHHKGGRREWIAWMEQVMREVLRVLKPGAHGLVWALPRTSHWTATALEDAGFEIRDCVYHLFGSGFPKSLDVSKAIDKAAGAKRRVVGRKPVTRNFKAIKGNGFARGEESETSSIALTAPATRDARRWQGFGTALKPAVECWWLIRKPLSEKNVAANVLRWGTGALNIDAGRIGTSEVLTGSGSAPLRHGGQNHRPFHDNNQARGCNQNPSGRFPSHLLLDEVAAQMLDLQSGRLIGPGNKRTRKAGNGTESKSLFGNDGGAPTKLYDRGGHASRFFYVAKCSRSERNAGTEGTLTWENVDQHLADLTDDLYRLAKDTSADGMRKLNVLAWNTGLSGKRYTDQFRRDFRFTIETASRLITALKTSNSLTPSRISGSTLDAIRMIEENGLSLAESAAFLKRLRRTITSGKAESVLGASHAVLRTLVKIRKHARPGNIHSTVKPQKLMRYLIRLVTPPHGIVLDPFTGSGSTGVAAKALGFRFVGIEREREYVRISRARIAHERKAA